MSGMTNKEYERLLRKEIHFHADLQHLTKAVMYLMLLSDSIIAGYFIGA